MQGIYEEWVRFLRQWAEDPHMDMSHLPVVSITSFPPQTFERLLKHMGRALGKVMDRWNEEFSRQMGYVNSEHELSQVLLHARTLLHRRVLVANHPHLPLEVREALMKEMRTQINSLQQQLEDSVSKNTNGWVLERSDLLRVVKATPLTVVLDADYGQQARVMEVVNAAEQYNYELSVQATEQEVKVQATKPEAPAKTPGFFRRLTRDK